MPTSHPTPPLILASQSPRRQELLHFCGQSFSTAVADIDEEGMIRQISMAHANDSFEDRAACIVMSLARAKSAKILVDHPDAVVIGADTVVTIDEMILGKPTSADDAYHMLQRLSGREHTVLTGVSLQSSKKEDTFFTASHVTFYPWDTREIEWARRYIATGIPMDKAGAYGIQDMGALLVKCIHGDFYTVMGLPVAEVSRRLIDFGY
jgi:septum formation protein